MSKKSPKPIQNARHYAVQTLYQAALTHTPISELMAHTLAQSRREVDEPYYTLLVQGAFKEKDKTDILLEEMTNENTSFELMPLEHSIVLIALFELRHQHDIPFKIIINEAINLSKTFAGEETYKVINHILDKQAKILRPIEYNAEK